MTTEEDPLDLFTSAVMMMTEDEVISFDEKTTSRMFRENCSVYNPCGRYGYCRDNKNDEWTCVCKFWWNGTRCDELSGSGTQIIALGVMLGVLIVVFHGLTLFRSIRKKQKLSKIASNTEKTPTVKRTFPAIPIDTLRPSYRIFSLITGILTLIVAASTLVAKWLILKPIHDEVVNKFHRKQSLFFRRQRICGIIDLSAQFNLFTFPVACLLIILFSIITKRMSFLRNRFCKDYIGIPIPIDFFAHVKRTLAAVVFAIFADELLEIAVEILSGRGSSSDRGIIVTYLMQIVRVFVIGFRRYPILAAVYIDNCFSLVCATLYAWLDYSMTIIYNTQCRNDYYVTEEMYNKEPTNRTIIYFDYYGTGSRLLFIQFLNDIPRYLCLAYISVKLPMLLIKRIRQRKLTDRQLTREQKNLLYSSLPHSAEARYVKRLLGIRQTDAPSNRFAQIMKYIYTWRDDFRFSSRVVCVYASVFLLLVFLTVEACIKLPPLLGKLHESAQLLANFVALASAAGDTELQKPDDPSADFPLPDFVRPYLFAVSLAFIIITIQLLAMLAGIRRNLLQAFRGDACELPPRVSSQNVSYVTGNFHFAGYLIGYVILAYVFLVFLVSLLGIAIDAFIIFGSVRVLERLLKLIIPAFLFVGFKLYLNKILGQYVFLQHGGEVLSINNRRAFMVFIYFNCFLDAFLGLIAAILRLLKSIVGGVIYMCRLDYSPLGRKLETMDAGFNAYRGFIYMECAHRHPVLLCFVSHLLRDYLYEPKSKRLSKARHKWHLTVFLLNNPILIYRRKGFLTRVQENEINAMLLGKTHPEEIYIEQPPIFAHRASIISEKELEQLWERRRF